MVYCVKLIFVVFNKTIKIIIQIKYIKYVYLNYFPILGKTDTFICMYCT